MINVSGFPPISLAKTLIEITCSRRGIIAIKERSSSELLDVGHKLQQRIFT
jgi:hypothetical protein